MNRVEAEKKIIELVEQIHEVHKKYNPNARFMLISYSDGQILLNNRYWVEDTEYPLNAMKLYDGRFVSVPRVEEVPKIHGKA